MYLTYTEYKAMGGDIADETLYNTIEYMAETKIDFYTYKRIRELLKVGGTLPTEVKYCVYALIKYLKMELDGDSGEDTPDNGNIQSRSNDGVSISYMAMGKKDLTDYVNSKVKDTIKMYLDIIVEPTHKYLLYRGMYKDE